MRTEPTLPACPAAILRRPAAGELEHLAQAEPDETTVIIEPDAMPPDLRALVAEARRVLGRLNV